MEAGRDSSQKQAGIADAELPEKIPFQLGAMLRIRSTEDSIVKGHAKIVGVLEKTLILVEEPVFENQERITGRVGGSILCAYFHDGSIYKFRSRFGQVVVGNIVCLNYPKQFETQQLRMHPRVKVNLEAVTMIGHEGRLINADIRDISEGGCCLELPGLIPLTLGTPVTITFELPTDVVIEDVGCMVRNMRHLHEHKKTIAGVSFTAPDCEIAKVKKFCDMCMYFRT